MLSNEAPCLPVKPRTLVGFSHRDLSYSLQGRCAAVLFYGHQLAVLPAAGADAPDFADDLELLDGGAGGSGAGDSVAAVANSFVVDLSAQGIREV